MADCCESYHLTFHGLKDCYLSGLNLNSIGLGRDIFFADKLIVSNRYDQQFSRLYIHEGRGFSPELPLNCLTKNAVISPSRP